MSEADELITLEIIRLNSAWVYRAKCSTIGDHPNCNFDVLEMMAMEDILPKVWNFTLVLIIVIFNSIVISLLKLEACRFLVTYYNFD